MALVTHHQSFEYNVNESILFFNENTSKTFVINPSIVAIGGLLFLKFDLPLKITYYLFTAIIFYRRNRLYFPINKLFNRLIEQKMAISI